jgi:ribokinase
MKSFVLGNYMHAHFLYVARLPVAGESLAAQRIFIEHGGKGLNLGLGLHRLEMDVILLMAIGCDTAGEAVLAALREEGMVVDGILQLAEQSGFGVGFITPQGDNFLAAHQGANALLTSEHVTAMRAEIETAAWTLAHFELADAPILSAFRLARACGASTYLNPSPWRTIEPELLALTDVLVVNESEAINLFGLTAFIPPQDWAQFLADIHNYLNWQGGLLVITLGAKGCIALAGEQIVEMPAYAIQQVDATGAGDAFGAGLVSGLIRGVGLYEALDFANACGALVAAREGIWAQLPTLTEVNEFRAAQGRASCSR